MGVDIHMYVEVWKDGHWRLQACQSQCLASGACKADCSNVPAEQGVVGRDHRLVCELGGDLNGQFVPALRRRGMPENMSEPVAEAYEPWRMWENGGSWFTCRELAEHDWRRSDGKNNEEWFALLGRLNRYSELFGGPDNVRIVFWLDT